MGCLDGLFRVLGRLPFVELADATVDSFLFSDRVILRSADPSLPFQSFDFTRPDPVLPAVLMPPPWPDNDKVREAGEYLRTHIASGGTTAPIPGATTASPRTQRIVVQQIRFFENGHMCDQWKIATTEDIESLPDHHSERWIVDRCGQFINYEVTFYAPGREPLLGGNLVVRLEP